MEWETRDAIACLQGQAELRVCQVRSVDLSNNWLLRILTEAHLTTKSSAGGCPISASLRICV